MYRLMLFTLIIFLFSCESPSGQSGYVYPDKVIEYELQNYFDRAKFELYRLNKKCPCLGTIEVNGKVDTFDTFEMDVDLIGVEVESDTIIFSLNLSVNGTKVMISDPSYGECTGFAQIRFTKGNNFPVLAELGCRAVVDYTDTLYLSERRRQDKEFIKCALGSSKTNLWLKKYIDEKILH